VETIGAALRAGTNCGSCLPELKRIVADAGAASAPTATSAPATVPSDTPARDPAVTA
jgi:NAD(P)H-nitrite reductase large subunit